MNVLIPEFTGSGVLPPFLGSSPASKGSTSPYPVAMKAIVARFASTPERVSLLRGLLSYREALSKLGIVDGYQWIGGSFLEDTQRRKVNPRDIDVITFAHLPVKEEDKKAFVASNKDLFSQRKTKKLYFCDAIFVDLDIPGKLLVEETALYYGLFSHQTNTSLWKGMLSVNLSSDDSEAREALGGDNVAQT